MPGTLRFDCFEVDLAAHELYKRGARIRLRDQSFQVLTLLLEHPGRVVTREDLRHRLWTDDVFVDFENGLNTAVARLREALSDSADRPRYIETLPRVGYRFIAPVVATAMSSQAPAAPAPKARLVVLPFVNSSGDPMQEYFSDAMTDEIIIELSALAPAQLAVIARTTAMHYKGTHKDVARIGRELTVDYVVEGSARRADNRVALTAQLIRASDQIHVFARRYEADAGDIFDVQRRVAQALAGQIGIVPATEERSAEPSLQLHAVTRPTNDLVAYNCYIQGQYHLARGGSPDNLLKARDFLERAVAQDPQFALAHCALAELWWHIGFFALCAPKESLDRGMPCASRAVSLDPGLAEARALLALYRKQLHFDWADMQREMAIALELKPWSPAIRLRHAIALMPHGRLDEAASELELALDLDPMALPPRMWLLAMFWLDRKYDRGIEQGRLLLEIEPTHFAAHLWMGAVCREAGAFDQAIVALRKAVELSGGAPLTLGWLGLALAESGDTAGARALLERLHGMPPTVFVPPTSIAWIHIGLGEIDEFFEWMNRAIDTRDHMITPIKSYPFLDSVRDDPRYVDLLRKMNLA